MFILFFLALSTTFYLLAIVRHLKNGSPTFAQMPNRITNIEYLTSSRNIANTMLAAGNF